MNANHLALITVGAGRDGDDEIQAAINWIDRAERRTMVGRLLALACEIETATDDNIAETLERARKTLRVAIASIS